MSGQDEKARKYIALLDTARSNATWGEAPELIRKVTKHAPQRKCLITTATLEHEIIKYRSAVGSRRPGTATAARSGPESLARIEALEKELRSLSPDNVDDDLQSHACLLWARWAASEGVKEPTDDELYNAPSLTQSAALSTWSKICVVKAAFIRGTLLARSERTKDAEAAYQSILPFLDASKKTILSCPQLVYWSEQLLAALAISKSHDAEKFQRPEDDDAASHAFRKWGTLSVTGKETVHFAYGHPGPHRSRVSVWKCYYVYLSDLLGAGSPDLATVAGCNRPEQVSIIRRVENAYEIELLRNFQFPRATETNTAIEEWIEQVIENWKILCGPTWSENDLGEGGRHSVGRNVIDILYRAAMKTFHSTLILRRLFQVHKSLADYDLAYKALDTYIELIERGRERAKKAGAPATGQDSDELVLCTIAEGIEGLCSYGRQGEAEKAYNLCLKLQLLLEEVDPSAASQQVPQQTNGYHEDEANTVTLSLESKDLVFRALGIGKAHWAIWTPFNERRSPLQALAVSHLTQAVNLSLPNPDKLKSLYALSLLLAETRGIDTALEHTKSALAQDLSSNNQNMQRQLIPIWHLLSLLLTARQDFDTAGHSCVAAFEQFSSPEALFGTDAGAQLSEKPCSGGLIDDMECSELQRIIEVRMTELALTDLSEGPEHAVNSSNELLALYFRLFGHLGVAIEDKPVQKTIEPPKSSAGTVRSFRGSVFGRKKMTSPSEVFKNRTTNGIPASIQSSTTRPSTQATQAPTIQVTDEDEKPSPHKHRLFRPSSERKRLTHQPHHSHRGPDTLHARPLSRDKRPPPSLSDISTQRQSFETSTEHPPSSTGTAETALAHQPPLSTVASADEQIIPQSLSLAPSITEPGHGSSSAIEPPVDSDPRQLDSLSKVPLPTSHNDRPLEQNVRPQGLRSHADSTTPITRFPRTAAQKHALVILVKVWLLVAALYRRSSLFDDSREAADEAAKAALRIESIVAARESSARAFADPGWGGGGKSSDEVWADVYCERAELQLAIARMKQEKGMIAPDSNEALVANQVKSQEGEVDNETVREAVELFETCLTYFPNHPGGIISLSNVLLDYYERKVELGRKVDDTRPKDKTILVANPIAAGTRTDEKDKAQHKRDGHTHTRPMLRSSDRTETAMSFNNPSQPSTSSSSTLPSSESGPTDDDLRKTPENLNRLAARDRAYGLLSSLTKLGSGWDNSEAWYALARAHELGGEVEKAKQILWWVVQLEDTRPLRPWRCVGGGKGYVL